MKKYFSILFMSLIMAFPLVMSSCGDDDDDAPEAAPEAANSAFTINGIEGGKIMFSLCGDIMHGGVAIEVHFNYGDELYDLDLEINDLKMADLYAGLEITDNLEINRFYPTTSMFWGDISYEITGGSAYIKSVGANEVVVGYNNLEFTREKGEYGTPETFILNGSISYTIE